MTKMIQIVLRWVPAFLVMLMIFLFSASPASDLPNFARADWVIKKGSHMIGYALLALSYWGAFQFEQRKRGLAWCFAVVYAITDEFHQSFVPGRGASVWDVVIFDNLGALISLWLFTIFKTKRSDTVHPIVENVNAKG
jgi:VanZ family protein